MAKPRVNRVLSERQQESRKRSHNITVRDEFARGTGSHTVTPVVAPSHGQESTGKDSSDHGKLSACGSINSRGLPNFQHLYHAGNRFGASQQIAHNNLIKEVKAARINSGSLNSRHR